MCRFISKMVLVVVNSVFALFSLIAAALGIWVAVERGRALSKMSEAPEDSDMKTLSASLRFMTPAIVFVVLSCFCLFLSICGCIGALKESSCMLTTYSVIMVILLIVQLAAIILAVIYRSRIEDQLVKTLTKADQKYFKPYMYITKKEQKGANVTDADIVSRIINTMHVSMKCCGVNGVKDITGPNTTWSSYKAVYKNKSMKVPASCCKLTDKGVEVLSDSDDWSDFGKYLPKNSTCPTMEADYHQQGCLPTIMETIKKHVFTVIVASAIYICFNILCIAMACGLIRNYRSQEN